MGASRGPRTARRIVYGAMHGTHGVSLFWRLFWVNAAILTLAGGALIVSPATVSSPVDAREAAVVGLGLCAMLVLNVALTRRAVAPLVDLREAMRQVDPLARTVRLTRGRAAAEIGELTTGFNEMLDRLEEERRSSSRRALDAQEGERSRIARELHDEVGQSLTVLLLQIESVADGAAPERRAALAELQESVRATMGDVRRIVRELRPEALDDLGLVAALHALADRVEEHGDIRVDRRLSLTPGALPPDAELVVYRVAQEGLTNVVRHASAHQAVLELQQLDGDVVMRLFDDGIGFGIAAPGAGLHGMRERAVAIGAELTIDERPIGGTVVALRVPGAS